MRAAEIERDDLDWKVFRDPVHGSIKLHPVLVGIIDTPQFQRLRDVKQLGASYWVYPGSCHNRFEHCIGTAYLCGYMMRSLKRRQDDLVSLKDILCAEIAGLCHDLGHGPFSHVFDNNYIKFIEPESTWTHEQGSIDMFDYMVDNNPHVQQLFSQFSINGAEIQLIKDMISGKKPGHDTVDETCFYEGKTHEKWFLYEVVSNKRNGIDCDKFDYLMRDCYFIGTNSNFDCIRYFQYIRIIPVDGQLQICVRDKEIFNLYELFHTRWSLHHRVYQHKTTKIVEQMLLEAMAKVDKKFGISASIREMSRYTDLSDSIIYEILRSDDGSPEVVEAKNILRRIQNRDLYKYCGQVNTQLSMRDENLPSSQEILQKGTNQIAEEIAQLGTGFTADDIFVIFVGISFGMRNYDPINSVVFFSKDNQPMKIRKEEISELLPQTFCETYIRVHCRDADKKNLTEDAFSMWCEENQFKKPRLLNGDQTGYFTDVYKREEDKMEMENSRLQNIQRSFGVRKRISYDSDTELV